MASNVTAGLGNPVIVISLTVTFLYCSIWIVDLSLSKDM